MLAAERWKKIEEIVNERQSIRVSELSEMCSVTEETIRRDLDKLESEGKLLRSHGGAVSMKVVQEEVPYPVRETTNADEKRRIAMEAIKHIEPGQRVVLDASTSAWWIAKLLPDLPLTVLTNSIKVALELSGKPKVHVLSTGGIVSAGSLSFVGPLAVQSLEAYHVDKVFLSCKGIHIEGGLSESNELQALVKRKMISIADRVYLLADYSKFGIRAFTTVTSWSSIDCVITDGKTDREQIRQLEERNVQVIRLPE